jgi:hypothetical protein
VNSIKKLQNLSLGKLETISNLIRLKTEKYLSFLQENLRIFNILRNKMVKLVFENFLMMNFYIYV